MSTRKVDVAVIGAGTAGLNAFYAIQSAGKKVVLIDKGPLGTTCARVGCMPSKAALHAGMRWKTARQLPGMESLPSGGQQALWTQVRQSRDMFANGTADRTRKVAGDDLILAEARFIAPGVLQAGKERIEAKAVVVAVGSSPIVPEPFREVDAHILTTDTLFDLETLPKHVGILGLGAIGLELGLALSRLGVDVVAADQSDTVGGMKDPAVQGRMLDRFRKELPMWLGSAVTVKPANGKVLMRNDEHSALVDRLLVVTGRAPNTASLDLGAADIPLDDKGRPTIDPVTMQAGNAAVFFAGDVQPDRPLQHEAADEGKLAAEAALAHLRGSSHEAKPRRAPISILFTDPDACTVGLDFDTAIKQGAIIGEAEGKDNGRSRILGAEANLLRIYVEPDTGALLGASMMLTHGEHLAHLLALAIQTKQTVNQLLNLPFYHPSIEEMLQSALKSAAKQLKGGGSAPQEST